MGSIPGRGSDGMFFPSPPCLDHSRGHPDSYPMGTGSSFPGGKAAGRVKLTKHHLEPKLRMSSPTCLHGVVLS